MNSESSSRSNSISDIVSALYTLPRMPERTWHDASERCDFVIQIDPTYPNPDSYVVSTSPISSPTSTPPIDQSYYGSTSSISDYYVPNHQQGNSFYMSDNSAQNHQYAVKRCRDLESQINYQSEQIRMVLWERDEWKNRSHALESELRRTQEQRGNYEQLYKEHDTLKSQLNVYLSNIKLLQTHVAESNKERDDLRGKYQLLEMYLTKVQEKVSSFDSLVQERDQLRDANSQLNDDSIELRQQNEDLEIEVNRLRDESNLLESQVQQSKDESENLRQRYEELETEYNRICEHVDAPTPRQSDENASQPDLHSDLEDHDDHTNNTATGKSQKGDLESANSSQVIASQAINERQKLAGHQRDESTTTNDDLSSEIVRLNNELETVIHERDELINKNNALLSEAEVLSRQREELKVHNNEFAVEAGKIKERFSSLAEQNNELQEQNHELSTELGSIQQVCSNLVQVRDELRNQSNELSTKILQLQEENQTLAQEKHGVQHEYDILKSQHEQLQECLHGSPVDLERDNLISTKVGEQDTDSNAQNNDISQTTEEQDVVLKAQNLEVESQLTKSRPSSDDLLQTEVSTLKLQIQRLQDESKNLMRQKEEWKMENTNLMTEMAKLQADSDHWTQERDELKAANDSLIENNSQLEEETNSLRYQHGETRKQNEELTSQVSHLQEELNTLVKRCDDLIKQNFTLTSEIGKLRDESSRSARDGGELNKVPSRRFSILSRKKSTSNLNDSSVLEEQQSQPVQQPSLPQFEEVPSYVRRTQSAYRSPSVRYSRYSSIVEQQQQKSESISRPTSVYFSDETDPETNPQQEDSSDRLSLHANDSAESQETAVSVNSKSTLTRTVSLLGVKPRKLQKSKRDATFTMVTPRPQSLQFDEPSQKQTVCEQCHKNPTQKKLLSKRHSRYCSSKCAKLAKSGSDSSGLTTTSSEITLHETSSAFSHLSGNLSNENLKHAY